MRLPSGEAARRRLLRDRLRNWTQRGVLEAPGKTLSWETFEAVCAFQGDRCALCGRDGFWGALAADHDRRTGLFRGCLCEPDCNRHAVGTFERTGRFGSPEQAARIRAYLDNPPFQRWRREARKVEAPSSNTKGA